MHKWLPADDTIIIDHEIWMHDLAKENGDSFEPKVTNLRRKERRYYVESMHKKVIALHNAYRAYWDEETYFWEKLPKPIFLYYRKSFKVRSELKNTPEYPVLCELCGEMTTTVTSRRRDFLEKRWPSKKRKVLMPKNEGISNYHYNKLSEKARAQCEGILCVTRWGSLTFSWYATRTWRWDEIKIVPVYAHWRGIPNSKAMSRHDEIGWQLYNYSSRYNKWMPIALNYEAHHRYHFSDRARYKRETREEILQYESDTEVAS